MNKKEFDELKKMILENDGITLSSDGKIAHLKKGYMVSLEGYEKIYKDIKFIDLKVLKSYLRKAQEKKAFVGFWLDSKKIYLDLSINVNEKEEALEIARINHQLAIYDCANAKEIRL